jgi:hypothetical protein
MILKYLEISSAKTLLCDVNNHFKTLEVPTRVLTKDSNLFCATLLISHFASEDTFSSLLLQNGLWHAEETVEKVEL